MICFHVSTVHDLRFNPRFRKVLYWGLHFFPRSILPLISLRGFASHSYPCVAYFCNCLERCFPACGATSLRLP